MPIEAVCQAAAECLFYVCVSPTGILYACLESCFICCQTCAYDCRQARDASGCHCWPCGSRGVQLPDEDGDEQQDDRIGSTDDHFTTTQPKWSAVAALQEPA